VSIGYCALMFATASDLIDIDPILPSKRSA